MIIKEFRILIPMTVDEYQIGQLYTIQKKSRIESVGHGSGVEIIENRPYENKNEKGQYTLKVFHVDERLPAALKTVTKLLFPKSALSFEEESWNSYPYTRTKYKHKLFKSFNIDIESKYLPDLGDTANAFNLTKSELSSRTIDYIDIVNDSININEYKAEEDPSIYRSELTNRGPLGTNWIDELKENALTTNKITYMCVYKLCRIECAFWGCQSRVEKLISESVLRHTILITHRQAWCWQDEYTQLTIEDVRRLEAETQRYLDMKMKNGPSPDKLSPTTSLNAIDINLYTNQVNNNNNNNDDNNLRTPEMSKSSLTTFGSSMTISNLSSTSKNSPSPSNLAGLKDKAKKNSISSASREKTHISYHKLKSNFIQNVSFDASNTEEFFDYVEDEYKAKDKLEFNLHLLNKNNDEDADEERELSSENSNIEEFYDAISQVSFTLSTNASECSSSNLMTSEFKNSQIEAFQSTFNHNVSSDQSKVKPVLSLKSVSSFGLPDSLDIHKTSSLGSFEPQIKSSLNKNITRQETLKSVSLETLILVVHGGNVTCTDTSKMGDFQNLKSKMDSLHKSQHNSCREKLIYRLVSCDEICKEALITLSTLSPIANEPSTAWKENGNFAEQSADAFSLNENLPFNTIPLLILANKKKYKEMLNKFIKECNRVYNEFVNSAEGSLFSGQVVLIGDSIGSILAYDALCASVQSFFSHFDESSSTTSSVVINNFNQKQKNQSSKNNSTSPSPSPSLKRNPLINLNDTQIDLGTENKNAQQWSSSSLSNSSGIEHNNTNFLSPPSPTLTPTLTKEMSCDERLEFDAAHFFVFGSPLGLLLAYRKLANSHLEIPSCTQIYNMFHLTDPVAIRIEPLLCKQFRHIQPCMVPRYSKFPMGDGSNLSLDHFIVKHGHLFETSNLLSIDSGLNGSENCYLTPNYDQLKSLQKIIQTKKEWWGENRIDYVLYAPEKLSNLPRNSLPFLFHSCFWESDDVVAFVLRMILKTENSFSFYNSSSDPIKNNIEPVEKWQRRFNRMKLRNLSPNHRANDVIVLEDKEQILNAKFSYGPLEFVLAGEKVDIYISNQGGQKQGDYQFYASELTDNHGKIKYQIPTKKLLPLGIYHVKMIVKCDHTYVEFYMAVLPIGTEAVVFSIDGSFAANLSLSGTDPKVRAGAVDVVRHWQDLGYLIIYITARPDMQHYKVTNWLSQHNFPLGMVFFSDGLRHDPIKQKAETLKNLVVNNNLSLQAAYGSAKDIQMYSNLGVNANRIYITGKTKTKYLNQAVILKDGYASHLAMLQNPNTGSRQALGNARLILKKNIFNPWHNQHSINLSNQISITSQISKDSNDSACEFLNNSLSNARNEKTQLTKLYSLQYHTKNSLK